MDRHSAPLYLIVLLTSLTSLPLHESEASITRERFYKSPAHPGKCFVDGLVMSVGQSAKHPSLPCAEVTCVNSIGLTTIESCDAAKDLPSPLALLKQYDPKNPPHCEWEDELPETSAPYPKCCRRYFRCLA